VALVYMVMWLCVPSQFEWIQLAVVYMEMWLYVLNSLSGFKWLLCT
jgi:hypothetical protein